MSIIGFIVLCFAVLCYPLNIWSFNKNRQENYLYNLFLISGIKLPNILVLVRPAPPSVPLCRNIIPARLQLNVWKKQWLTSPEATQSWTTRSKSSWISLPPSPFPHLHPKHNHLLLYPPNHTWSQRSPNLTWQDPLGWIFKIQQFFDYQGIPEAKRLTVAAFYMEGPALSWYRWMYKNCFLTLGQPCFKCWNHDLHHLFMMTLRVCCSSCHRGIQWTNT